MALYNVSMIFPTVQLQLKKKPCICLQISGVLHVAIGVNRIIYHAQNDQNDERRNGDCLMMIVMSMIP